MDTLDVTSQTCTYGSPAIITPRACARGKVIGFVVVVVVVVVHKKIARSRLIRVIAMGYRHDDVKNGEKLTKFCFNALGNGHKR